MDFEMNVQAMTVDSYCGTGGDDIAKCGAFPGIHTTNSTQRSAYYYPVGITLLNKYPLLPPFINIPSTTTLNLNLKKTLQSQQRQQ